MHKEIKKAHRREPMGYVYELKAQRLELSAKSSD